MNVLSLDEARLAIVTSARRLLRRCATDDPFTVVCMLWGAGLEHLDGRDRTLADRHRQLLDVLIVAGYWAEAADELDGISSAAGLDDGRIEGENF